MIVLLLLALAQDGGERPTGRPVGALGMSVPHVPAVAIGTTGQGRRYHLVTLAQMATTKWTHVEICGLVVYVRKQQDGDVHVTLDDGSARVVVEIVPLIKIAAPRKGQIIRVRGIARYDKGHRFHELHPAESLEVVASCR